MQTLELFRASVQQLHAAGVEAAENDTRLLFEHQLRRPRFLWPDQLSETEVEWLEQAVNKRAQRYPLAYILGKMWFYGLELVARPGVFCVRPETELLVETALRWVRDSQFSSGQILDLCSGSGAIALALTAELPNWQVTGVEISDAALAVARENAANLGLSTLFQQADATVLNSQWVGKMQVVVSNPPYIPPRELPAETDFEPAVALWGLGEDGMQIPAQIIKTSWDYLQPAGLLLLEHDDFQGESARAVALERGFTQVRTIVDLTGAERFLFAVKPPVVEK